MKKLLAPILAACLMVGGETVLAENWISFQDSRTTLIDTDSYVDSGLRSSLSIKSKGKEGETISNIEFDKNSRAYRVTEMKTLDEKGAVTNDFTYSDDPQNWSPLVPHSFGMNLYNHYVENPLPHFTKPQWLVIYKEDGVRFHGSTYDVEKNTISYKDGYATFWIRISYPWKDQDFSSVIYHVKMDVPHKRIQTLSMTRYDYDGKVQSHGAGSKDRETITEGSPMEKVHDYINKELLAGHIRMMSSL